MALGREDLVDIVRRADPDPVTRVAVAAALLRDEGVLDQLVAEARSHDVPWREIARVLGDGATRPDPSLDQISPWPLSPAGPARPVVHQGKYRSLWEYLCAQPEGEV